MNEIVKTDAQEIMEAVISKGDLSKLTPAERNTYYDQTCRSLGLNPLTRPFEYITLQGKQTLYARRDACDQLRKIHGISIDIVSQELKEGMFFVHVRATNKDGRHDEDLGVVPMAAGAADIRANQTMKAITKGKRRVTLSICGLGFLDETEVEDIPREQKKLKVQDVPGNAALGELETVYEDSRPVESPADPADAPSPSVPPGASAGLSQPAQMYAAQMDKAAEQGMKQLSELWARIGKINPGYQKQLEHLKAEWKVTAQAADASKGKKTDTLV